MLYSLNNQYPSPLPNRIRLSNGLTRTDKTTFTDEEIADAGYVAAPSYPDSIQPNQKVEWTGTDWAVIDMSDTEYEAAKQEMWAGIRRIRDSMIQALDWRILRTQAEMRLGLTPTDDLLQLDAYLQALRDITKQADPFNVVWPDLPWSNPTLNILDV